MYVPDYNNTSLIVLARESKCGKATGYAVISIRTAWLSYHYPLEFMTALLNSNINKPDKLEHYVSKIKTLGFSLLGPDVNESDVIFSIDRTRESIRFGLRGIKGLGAASSLVVGARGDSKFSTMTDFVNRLNAYFKCDKKVLESIAQCGGFESIEANRKAVVKSAEMIVEALKKDKKKNVAGQISMFDFFSEEDEIADVGAITLKKVEDYTKDEKLALEKKALSFYVSGHPLDKYDDVINKSEKVMFISDIKNIVGAGEDEFGMEDELGFSEGPVLDEVLIVGQIIEEETRQTKKQELMAKIVIEDKTSTIPCVLFPRQREAYRSKILKGNIVAITGKVESNDFGTQVIVSDVSTPQILSAGENPVGIILESPFSREGIERSRAISLYRRFVDFVKECGENGDLDAKFIVDDVEVPVGKIPSSIDVYMKLKTTFGEDKIRYEY